MSRTTRLAFLSLPLALIALSGCATAVDDSGKPDSVVALEDTRVDEPAAAGNDATAGGVAQPPTTEATPVYFNESNYIEGTPDQDASYSFELLPESRIAIHLERAADTGPKELGFTLYRISTDGTGVIVGHVVDTDGTADAELWSEHGGTYAIEVAGGQTPSSLILDLSCLGGQCSKSRQPGQTCGSSDPYVCADGLVCRFADAMCKAGDSPAKCQIPPSSCSSVRAPVCGCDGQTWGNECFARQAGVSVMKNGECDNGK